MSTTGALAVLFGIVMVFAWYISVRRVRQRGAKSVWSGLPAHIFTGIITVSEFIIIASLAFGHSHS